MRLGDKVINYIEVTKARSEEEKKRAAIWWTIVLTLIIFVLWVSVFSVSVANRQAEDSRLREEASTKAKMMSLTNASSTLVTIDKTNDSLPVIIKKFFTDGASSVEEGFWAIGSWLHK